MIWFKGRDGPDSAQRGELRALQKNMQEKSPPVKGD